MITLNVKVSGMKEIEAALQGMSRQIPYAASNAINELAAEVQKEGKAHIRSRLTVRGTWLDKSPIALKRTFANKKKLSASISTTAKFLPRQEEGGTKLPYRHWLAIPTSNVQRTASGQVRKKDKPANLTRKFVITTRHGQDVLFQRTGTEYKGTRAGRRREKTGGIQAMYMLEPKARIKKATDFYRVAQSIVDKKWKAAFTKAINHAMNTAR
jgi:hypothetical protein